MVKTSDIKPQTLGEKLKKGFDKFADKLAADKSQESIDAEAKNAKTDAKLAKIDTAAQIKAAAREDYIDR